MATLTGMALNKLSKQYSGLTGGQVFTMNVANIGGDLVPLSGEVILVALQTFGTVCVWTIDSIAPSSYGIDNDITVTLGATDFQIVAIINDGRFDQGGGSAGLAKFTPSTVTGVPKIGTASVST